MSLFCCPNCMAPLSRQQNRMVCPAGHSFDMARSGYVNLLLSQQISQKHHGDDKRMVCARSAFLAGGYYDPMRQELIRQAMVEARPGMTVLDAGCGEGYYTAELVRRLREGGYAPQAAGIDISKFPRRRCRKPPTGRRGRNGRLPAAFACRWRRKAWTCCSRCSRPTAGRNSGGC